MILYYVGVKTSIKKSEQGINEFSISWFWLQLPYQGKEVSVDEDTMANEGQVVCDIDAIDSDSEVPDQGVDVARVLQDKLPDVGDFIRWISLLVVRPEVEASGVEAVSDQGVVTVTLEVVLLLVKGYVVRVSPDLTVSRCCKKNANKKSKAYFNTFPSKIYSVESQQDSLKCTRPLNFYEFLSSWLHLPNISSSSCSYKRNLTETRHCASLDLCTMVTNHREMRSNYCSFYYMSLNHSFSAVSNCEQEMNIYFYDGLGAFLLQR